jgi:hypothetical protein
MNNKKLFIIFDSDDRTRLAIYLTDNVSECQNILDEISRRFVYGEIEWCEWKNEFLQGCKNKNITLEEFKSVTNYYL